ncbi:Cytochrome B5-like protein [Hibiscus syriacus]|uniref:Cytochrome B5-like protein n=1 Tax=Hibiscus syriacus TaxID=106335 RepID=A0A6A2Y1M9_HIBSY|nr:cytochrome B5-like protein [Hibiscus syriacus]XP_039042830.1 cytochrome B5-like protein [Hibiscus syriacus]KAE8665569.1 Cytochrome B5-like protein [Hibiscus syriacus]
MEIAVIALILAVLLGAFVLIPPHGKSAHKNKVKSSVDDSKASKSYSKSEVMLHNKRTDCWIIIKDKVYDVTSYVEEHPGGDAILAHAGDDSTEGFFGPQHATRVFDMIDDFYIGDLQK